MGLDNITISFNTVFGDCEIQFNFSNDSDPLEDFIDACLDEE
ncbi:hypothetical protein [Bacillus cereus]|nr:hypothetical protein [Bacillus cereus]MEB2584705.1 hypothetical protein [Bacillus cereus]MEB2612184.1 hypothetical protein [Bacillus cereus]